MIRLGEKIKSLGKKKNISQEVFANHLNFQFTSYQPTIGGQIIKKLI